MEDFKALPAAARLAAYGIEPSDRIPHASSLRRTERLES